MCKAASPDVTIQPMPVQKISSLPGSYDSNQWLSDEWVIFNYTPDLEPSNAVQTLMTAVYRMHADGSDMESLTLPEDSNQCGRNEFGNFRMLADGRLAFLRFCFNKKHSPDPFDIQGSHLMVGKLNGEFQLLRPYELDGVMVSLAPDASRGIASTRTFIEDKLFWLEANNVITLEVGLARSNSPVWSPGGESIVFFGNRQVWGPPGPSWGEYPYDLWLMPANCETLTGGCAKNLQLLVNDIGSFRGGLSWSPDGQWLAFDGKVGNEGQGVWLRQMDNGSLIQVVAGEYGAPQWSPDGRRILVLGPPEEEKSAPLAFLRSALYVLDVSEVVGKNSGGTP